MVRDLFRAGYLIVEASVLALVLGRCGRAVQQHFGITCLNEGLDVFHVSPLEFKLQCVFQHRAEQIGRWPEGGELDDEFHAMPGEEAESIDPGSSVEALDPPDRRQWYGKPHTLPIQRHKCQVRRHDM